MSTQPVNALDALIADDEAHHLEIGYHEDGTAVVTVDDYWDEIAVYEGDDLDDRVRDQAQALVHTQHQGEHVNDDEQGTDPALIYPAVGEA